MQVTKARGQVEVEFPLFLTPTLDGVVKFHITAILFPGKETSDTHWIWGWAVPRSFLEALQNIPYVPLCRTPEDANTAVPRNIAKKQAVRFRKTRILYPSIYSQQSQMAPSLCIKSIKFWNWHNVRSALSLDNFEKCSRRY